MADCSDQRCWQYRCCVAVRARKRPLLSHAWQEQLVLMQDYDVEQQLDEMRLAHSWEAMRFARLENEKDI